MKKHILLITNGFPFGESERGFLSEEIKALTATFEVSVLALDRGEELRYGTDGLHRIEKFKYSEFSFREKCDAVLQVLRPTVLTEVLRFGHERHFQGFLSGIKEILVYYEQGRKMSRTIADLVAAEKIDLVYTYWCTEATLGALLAKKRKPDLEVVTRFHGYDLYEERTQNGWQPFRTLLIRNADFLFFACETAKAYFEKRWGGARDRMCVSYLGSAERKRISCKPSGPLRLISCSNLIPLKRVERIIEALALLPEEVQVCWDHIGDGIQRQVLERLAQSRLTGDGVQWKFWGAVANVQLQDVYQSIHGELFVTTSSTEGGVPVSIQEAASMGIPAIATAVGGIPEIVVHEKTGLLLSADPSAEEIAQSIMTYIKLPEEKKAEMAQSAYQLWMTEFNAERNAEKFVGRLQKLMDTQG